MFYRPRAAQVSLAGFRVCSLLRRLWGVWLKLWDLFLRSKFLTVAGRADARRRRRREERGKDFRILGGGSLLGNWPVSAGNAMNRVFQNPMNVSARVRFSLAHGLVVVVSRLSL